jgi:RNA polymerase sigma-70 factor (ECF subfamily)
MNEQPQMDDAALARAAQGGDMAAFETLLTRHESRLYSFLRQMSGRNSEAEDIAQTVWVTVHRNLHRYDPTRAFTTWLFTIARNTAISAWRKQKQDALELQEHDWVDREHPAEKSFARDEAASIWSWIGDNLSTEQRDALWLMYREDMSARDIARTLGCSTVRVKVMMHRARKKLLKAHAEQPAAGIAEIAGTL